MVITSEQVAFFGTFGFLFVPQAFSASEMRTFSERFDERLAGEREGVPFPGETRQSLYGIAETDSIFTELVADDRICQTVETLLGEGFVWLNSEGNLYVGDTEWHPDGTRLDYRPMKVSLYLDTLTADSGCLRVIPGSHRMPFHDQLRPIDRFGLSRDIPCCILESQPGDVLFADMNTWHASFGGAPGRRHLAVNFVPEPKTESDIVILRKNHEGVLRNIQKMQYSQPGRAFSHEFLHSHHPRIKRMTAKWVELGLG